MAAPNGQGRWMQSAVGFGGYPEFQDRRFKYNLEEPPEPCDADLDDTRRKLQKDLARLRLLHEVMLHLHRGDFKPAGGAQPARTSFPGTTTAPRVELLELRAQLKAGGWQGMAQPLLFDQPPDLRPRYACREALLSKAKATPKFQTATVLSDPLAAQFGPSMLGDDRSFQEASGNRNCFTQLVAGNLSPGTVPWDCWQSIPAWMRCSMVVVSTGPGGSGVAFHKHGTAWLALQQGRKRWWLYPPSGPPAEAYAAVALCPAADLPEVVSRLPPEQRPLEIVQQPGDCVFVPALWWHATYDEGPTLGIGSQFSMAELDILQCQQQYPTSAFALYHAACEIHKTEEAQAVELFEAAIAREPLNFYFATNQVLFYLNMVFHPRLTISVIMRLLARIRGLDARRQMVVQRFFIPTICNFADWHVPHDRLLKYSVQAAECAWQSLLELMTPLLPGGGDFRLGSGLPWNILHLLEYTSKCFHCGAVAPGKPGEPGSVRAHRFFCLRCASERSSARCRMCGAVDAVGQLGTPSTPFAQNWYCNTCWTSWKEGIQPTKSSFLFSRKQEPWQEIWDIVD